MKFLIGVFNRTLSIYPELDSNLGLSMRHKMNYKAAALTAQPPRLDFGLKVPNVSPTLSHRPLKLGHSVSGNSNLCNFDFGNLNVNIISSNDKEKHVLCN